MRSSGVQPGQAGNRMLILILLPVECGPGRICPPVLPAMAEAWPGPCCQDRPVGWDNSRVKHDGGGVICAPVACTGTQGEQTKGDMHCLWKGKGELLEVGGLT